MKNITRIRSKTEDNRTEIQVLIQHPMESDQRHSEQIGDTPPAHYIEEVRFERNGRLAARAMLGPGVAANPIVGIALDDTKSGDKVMVRWIDNQGFGNTVSTTIT